MFRLLRRSIAKLLRMTEAIHLILGGAPWKIGKFNHLMEDQITAVAQSIARAKTIVGIPFYRETENIDKLTRIICQDLEARREPAAVVIVSEGRARHLLAETPPASAFVSVVTLVKPFGFAQKPGLTRRSWSHWAILRLANRLTADIVFIDADVVNPNGWVDQYLGAIRDSGAAIAVANYVREFGTDDALVHVWDSLIFGALFKTWIAFRHGGDYAISRAFIPEVLGNPGILRERAYTMDSAVMRLAVQRGARIEPVWLGEKIHAPITPETLFNRLPVLVESVFDDVADHLSLLVKLHSHRSTPREGRISQIARPMRDLVGDDFRRALFADQAFRFRGAQHDLKRLLGRTAFDRLAGAGASPTEGPDLSPRDWARVTTRFLKRYTRTRGWVKKTALAKAYVPILQLGVLGFLNRTYSQRYDEAMAILDEEYLPAFEQTWSVLAHRIRLSQFWFLRKSPMRLRRKLIGVFRVLFQPGTSASTER